MDLVLKTRKPVGKQSGQTHILETSLDYREEGSCRRPAWSSEDNGTLGSKQEEAEGSPGGERRERS